MVAVPLTQLMRNWCNLTRMRHVNKALRSWRELLQNLNPSLPYLVDTDANPEGVQIILSKVVEEEDFMVAYYSANFRQLECSSCVTRKEILVMVESLLLCISIFTYSWLINHTILCRLKVIKIIEGRAITVFGLARANTVLCTSQAECTTMPTAWAAVLVSLIVVFMPEGSLMPEVGRRDWRSSWAVNKGASGRSGSWACGPLAGGRRWEAMLGGCVAIESCSCC